MNIPNLQLLNLILYCFVGIFGLFVTIYAFATGTGRKARFSTKNSLAHYLIEKSGRKGFGMSLGAQAAKIIVDTLTSGGTANDVTKGLTATNRFKPSQVQQIMFIVRDELRKNRKQFMYDLNALK